MRFLFRVCQFFFVAGILSMLFGTADQLFSLGIWHGAYPPVQTNASGHQSTSTYGEFMLYAGATALVGLAGAYWLGFRLARRSENAILILEAMREQGFEEAQEQQHPLDTE